MCSTAPLRAVYAVGHKHVSLYFYFLVDFYILCTGRNRNKHSREWILFTLTVSSIVAMVPALCSSG